MTSLLCLGAVLSAARADAPPPAWSRAPDLPLAVQEIYPAVHRGRIYVAGGVSSELPAAQGHVSAAVQVFDPQRERWSAGPDLPEPRHHAQLLSLGESLYLFGGFVRCAGGDWCASDRVLRLDEAAGRWSEAGRLPRPLTESSAFAVGPLVHLVGGRSPRGAANAQWGDHEDRADHLVFDTRSGRTTWLPDLPERKSSTAAATLPDGRIYLAGGRAARGANVDSLHAFDPRAAGWQALPAMPRPQAAHASVALGAQLCSFGGEYADDKGGGVLDLVQCYDSAARVWRAPTRMPEARHGLGAVVLGPWVYVIGGAARPGLAATSARVDRLRY
ncbi:galactose oxidase [Roseateles sp. DAIF2]|uniref:Kelch repeat-containing protein n=1 Tax=Roseateles sp. DAIF2 TaxID=2714952 RepID=UPI0018A2B239|nr:galactose oxidase [Roseateles sp. DAIF2]QPF76238.1 galactose oxidase [Roseateles sp. DAIF2]